MKRHRPRALGRFRRLVLASLCAFVALAFAPGAVAGAKERPTTRVWDPRVASIASAVSRIRGLSFTHPIPVNFVAPRRFEARTARDMGTSSKAAQRWFRNEAARLRALGLLPAGVDLAEALTKLSTTSVLAYYDPSVQEIFVKGTKLDVFSRVTVAHEMTHALDDQNLRLDHDESKIHDRTSELAIRSLVEGDAEWVMLRYLGSLTTTDHRRYVAADRAVRASISDRLAGAGIPSILDVDGSAPYSYGALMIDGVRARGGRRALDERFRHPATDDRSVLLVEAPVAHGADMAPPVAPAGERRIMGPDRLGSVGLYHVLASRLDADTALRAAGDRLDDRMVVTRRADGVACVHSTIAARNTAGRARLDAALRAWVAKGSPGAATVGNGLEPESIAFDSCDQPGSPAPPDFTSAATLLMLRSEVANAGLRAHVPRSTLACAADHLLQDPAVAAAAAAPSQDGLVTTTRLRAAVAAEVTAAEHSCGARLEPHGITNRG